MGKKGGERFMSLGKRIRERRKELGMTRVELAALLGVSPSAVGN